MSMAAGKGVHIDNLGNTFYKLVESMKYINMIKINQISHFYFMKKFIDVFIDLLT